MSHVTSNDDQLWTSKYAPRIYADFIGNKALVTALATWLRDHQPTTSPCGALISGPPGIGKTTCAHLVASKEGFTVLEFNASDTRSKKLLAVAFKESTESHTMTKYMESESTIESGKRLVIIMDEVDGMSSGDHGGLAELVLLLKKSQVPIICICNDRNDAKMKTLAQYCLDLRFQKPPANAIEERIQAVAKMEKLDVKNSAIQTLIESTGADIRQILNVLSTYRQGIASVNADHVASKDIPPANVFVATERLFTTSAWRTDTFTEKMQHYFDDDMTSLMVHESYLRSSSRLAQTLGGSDKKKIEAQALTCIAAAAESISLADTVDKQLRDGQKWALMPIHNVMSTVQPCFYTHGKLLGRVAFPSWFGHNSISLKMNRQLSELETHMHPRISGSKREVRLGYIPLLRTALTKPLLEKGKDGIDELMSLMNGYGITREDWDSVQELCILGEGLTVKGGDKAIPATTKAAFTRAYGKVRQSFEPAKKGKVAIKKRRKQ